MPNHMLIDVSPKKSCTFAKSKNENVSQTRSDNVTSYPSVDPMELGFISNTFSKKTPSAISTYNSDFHTTYRIIPPCSFNGKEKDPESGFHYYGARYYWSELLTGWLSVDPMADKYPGISPYAYCAWNPAILVDPDGKNDRPFRDGDKHVHDIQGTATFIMTNLIGLMQVYSPYSILNAYNCHSFAWHGSWGDKNPASGDIPYDQYGITSLPRWDQNPADDIRGVINRGGRQLGSDEDNIRLFTLLTITKMGCMMTVNLFLIQQLLQLLMINATPKRLRVKWGKMVFRLTIQMLPDTTRHHQTQTQER